MFEMNRARLITVSTFTLGVFAGTLGWRQVIAAVDSFPASLSLRRIISQVDLLVHVYRIRRMFSSHTPVSRICS